MQNKIDEYINEFKDLRPVTLCYLVDEAKHSVLIAMKKHGFGVGKLNGVSGKLEKGETVEQAMIRETREEVGVVPTEYKKVATISFYFGGEKPNPDFNQTVHVFIANAWEGNPSESEEMKPEWVDIKAVPLDLMWDDDKYWLPQVLSGKSVDASFLFDEKGKVIDMKINYKSKAKK